MYFLQQLSNDGTTLTITHGTNVSFWDCKTLQKVKEISTPTLISSASLHPEKQIFVAGGEDFKMYKFDYLTGNEIGKEGLTNQFSILKTKY